MRTLTLIIISVCLALLATGQENKTTINEISEALAGNVMAKTKVFIKTDKDIYSPGEKIWFKAEAYNTITQNPTDEPELVVMLKSESGQVIVDNKYLITLGTCSNKITIPSWAGEGNAFLVAYTPKTITTSDASLSAVKAITINTLRRNDYLLDVKMNREVYKPGDEVKLLISPTAITPGSRREKLEIALYDYNQLKFSEKLTVKADEITEFEFKLPSKVSNGFFLDIRSAGKSNINRKIPVYTIDDNLVIEFYPEGGTLLGHNLQRVLYRATNPFGEPIEVSGKVYDQLNNEVGIGKSMKKGYGVINLMPVPSQKYRFVIESAYGKKQSFELPHAEVDGCVFSLQKTEDSTLRVTILANGRYINDTITLAAIANGSVQMAYKLPVGKKTNMKISTADLPRGIINFIILHSTDGILSERLAYNTPNEDIDIDISTHFTPSEHNGDVDVILDISNFISKFGSSVTDVSIVDKYTLFDPADYEYHSFLKYPLKSPVPETVLDIYLTNLELIANEYKYFDLENILSGDELFKPVRSKTISGYVTDKNRQPVANATVMALQQNNLTLATATTNEKGQFVFGDISNVGDVTIKAFSSSGKKTYTVHLNQTFDESLEELILLKSFKPRYELEKDAYFNYCNTNSDLLKLVGSETHSERPSKGSRTEKMLQSGSSILDVIKMTKPFRLDGNQIVFYGSSNSLNFQSGALIVIDGQKMGTDITVLNSINPFDVKSINISTNAVDIQKYTGLNSVGIIEITTRQKPEDFLPKTQNEQGFQAKSFFDASAVSANVWKYQTTLFWGNDLVPGEDGKIELHLKANEIRTEYVVRVEVISENGVRHHQISTFSTKER